MGWGQILSAHSKARKGRIGGDFGRLKCNFSAPFLSSALSGVSKVFAFPFEKCVQ
jgi:hypothetical protein